MTSAALLALAAPGRVAAAPDLPADTTGDTTAAVRKALAKLPYYGLFDFLAFKVAGGTVTLQGVRAPAGTRARGGIDGEEGVPGMEPYGTYPVHIIVKDRRLHLVGLLDTSGLLDFVQVRRPGQ